LALLQIMRLQSKKIVKISYFKDAVWEADPCGPKEPYISRHLANTVECSAVTDTEQQCVQVRQYVEMQQKPNGLSATDSVTYHLKLYQ